MQYHLNGFQSGDPRIHEQADDISDRTNDEVDVLIVGCGPAGLTLAAQLSAFGDINTRIVERKDGPLQLGQADGLACRTLEMFEAFGFSDRVIREAYNVVETVFWSPGKVNPECIVRSGRIQDVADDLSEMPHLILNQARVHDMYLEVMRQSARRLQPDYCCHVVELDDSTDETFVSVGFERGDGRKETVRARYVVGCDGARSTIRECIGHELKGDSANQAWGVMDLLLVTDFPDIRYKSVIRSSEHGNVLIIPREGGYLVRFYIELDQLKPGERVSARKMQPEDLINAAKRIFHPYFLDVKQIVWWSVYEIGQRLCSKFDNSGPSNDKAPVKLKSPRVFIAGDACHTHSPKAGQGMNVGMADSFNLGWKLAAVVRGLAPTELLLSYTAERQLVARDLIEFDRHWAARFSQAADTSADTSDDPVHDPVHDPVDSPVDGTVSVTVDSSVGVTLDRSTPNKPSANNADNFQTYFSEHGRYTAGVSVKYPQSTLIADNEFQSLAIGWTIGMRFHSAMVTRLADALPVQLAHVAKADGRWRLFVFASQHDPADRQSPMWQLCEYLSTDSTSPMRQYQHAADDPDAVIDLRVVFQQSHERVNIHDTHAFLMPIKGTLGLLDTEKIFCSVTKNEPDIFDKRNINRNGCMVLVRPDQYVADVMPLDATDRLSTFFSRIFIPVQAR